MGSKDKRMCTETGNNNKVGWYEAQDDDCLGDFIPNILEDPGESLGLDEDCLTDDWESKLGPIPAEVFPGMLPPGGIGIGGYPDHLTECSGSGSGSSVGACEAKFQPRQPPTLPNGKKLHLIPKPFQAPSPDSVLERRTPSSSWALSSLKSECKRTRTKRLRGLTTSWSKLGPTPVPKRRIYDHNVANVGVKKCSHCEITKTPQWREGPMGPKTLCNACGVRYRSGRLFPEYRPAASPTFVPALHSNSHRKVVELRKKAAGIDDKT